MKVAPDAGIDEPSENEVIYVFNEWMTGFPSAKAVFFTVTI
jgi:hypothetical protein